MLALLSTDVSGYWGQLFHPIGIFLNEVHTVMAVEVRTAIRINADIS